MGPNGEPIPWDSQRAMVLFGQQSAQEWTNRTLIGKELLICSKMCFTKTNLVQE